MQFVELIFWLFKYFNVLLAVHIVLVSLKFNYSLWTKGTPNMQLFRILRFGSFVCFSCWNPSLLTWRYEIYWCFISKNYILPFSLQNSSLLFWSTSLFRKTTWGPFHLKPLSTKNLETVDLSTFKPNLFCSL